MSRDYKVYLEDILDAAKQIRQYIAGMSLEEFSSDRKTVDAVLRNLEVIGEASKNVPADVRANHPEADWKRIAGLRDILIHQYFGVDLVIIWDVIEKKLPELEQQAERMLRE
jgi:uncharacterized protein with HEPN domain